LETTSNSKNVITVTNLRKNFGNLKDVDGISFEVKQGTTTALLGGNGRGKTSTIAMLLGLLLPSGGEIRILNKNMIRHRYRVLKHIKFHVPLS
jgi:ABC-2 type transport system ATP-binding protein